MKKIFFLFLLICAYKADGQCIDTTSYHGNCDDCYGLDFAPVCGCDGMDYRTECEAFNCGNLLQDSATICDYVQFEFRPTLISETTPNTGTVGRICVFAKYSGGVVVQIYNSFGTIMYENLLIADYDNVFLPGNIYRGSPLQYLEIPEIGSFERGVYIVIVTVDGQSKTLKIMKM